MNTGTLLTRIRLEQRSLIDINKKLYELEHLLPAPAPEQFIKTAKSAALLSERSTAQLRNFLFTVCGGMPQDYYLQAAEMQGIRLNVDDDILSVRLPALLLKKTRTEGFKFLQPAIHAALKQYEKPPIFSPAASGPFHIEQPYFYDSREMKEAELEMLKIRGSRMAGALFTSNRVFAVYNSMEFLPVFEPQVEMRSKVMLEQVCRTKISFNLKASGLLLSDNMDILHTLLARSRTRSLDHFLLNDGYEHFYFLTNNSYGETLLQLLCCPEITMQVNAALLQEFQPSLPNSRLECDAVDDSGAPILFCYLPDIPRLYRFVSALDLLNSTGILVCFDFQADALRPLCGDNIELQIIDFQNFKARFLPFI